MAQVTDSTTPSACPEPTDMQVDILLEWTPTNMPIAWSRLKHDIEETKNTRYKFK
jgi:hypothetical protein